MPPWLNHLFQPPPRPLWNDNIPSGSTINMEKDASHTIPMMQTSITSTAYDIPLPPPVVQSSTTSSRNKKGTQKSARFSALSVFWANFKKRIGTGTAPSSSSVIGESAVDSSSGRKLDSSQDDEVDEVVVDRSWTEDIKSSVAHSEHGGNPEKSGGSHSQQHKEANSDHESVNYGGIWSSSTPLGMLRWRTWPFIMEIFSSRFIDEKSETHYAQESWFLKKSLALTASVWLIVNWVLGCVFIPHNPIGQLDKIFYFGVAPVLSLPVVFMIMYDWPRDRPILYQIFLVVSIWCWSFYQVISILACGYYTNTPHCQGKDFMATFYYTSALQTIALFGLRLNRFPAAIGALIFFLFASISVIPHRSQWARSMINFFIFQAFLIYVHYVSENSERRLYTLRDQLKVQFRATQKAQINERKASDSKRRLTSYVFHDMYHLVWCPALAYVFFRYLQVRVPLNTALLAVQNMEASGTIAKDQEIEFNALCGSLSMMSKVLNDVLDFNRMDSGRFESMSRPYGFHHVMRSLFVPLQLATNARGLKFETILDPHIDIVARKAAYKAMGESMESIREHIQEHPDVVGVVTGDETRLRQIITNLASNACKFTPAGGKLTIRTRLIIPTLPPDVDPLTFGETENSDGHLDVDDMPRPLSQDYLTQHNMEHSKPTAPIEKIVVRIEVSDTGYGIRPQDMIQSKLFSAFNQTEQGRQQGGKGTGLGLALVRQIVKLSGGRLGVRSKANEGSTFWVELPLGVGSKTFITGPPDLPEAASSSDLDALQRTNKVKLYTQCSANSIMAIDAAGLRVSRKASISAQQNSAMQGIMEQGGRVELVLRKRRPENENVAEQNTSRNVDTPLISTELPVDALITTMVQPLTPEELPQDHIDLRSMHAAKLDKVVAPPYSSEAVPANGALRQPESPPTDLQSPVFNATTHEIASLTNSAKATPVQRPTYVRLPTPTSFSTDRPSAPDTSPSESVQFSPGGKHLSNLKTFDENFNHGTPSVSFNAINIEPDMPVLVVDDDPLTRTLMKRILTRLGCQVSVAENGEVALEMILGQRINVGVTPSTDTSGNFGPILEQTENLRPFDPEGKYAVVFLDNQMPVLSGLKVTSKLRELGRNDFIVGVTGNALLSDQEEYLEAGVDRVLTKPVLERSLRDVLVQADGRRKEEKQERATNHIHDDLSSKDPHTNLSI